MPFPLPFIPVPDYHKPDRAGKHARWFGAPREGGRRLHAGCDLIAPLGTDIFAIADGVVDQISREFYHGTSALALSHTGGFVVRYCEVLKLSIAQVKVGQVFKAGDVIAQVGKMLVDSMLHHELYSGALSGPLSTGRGGSPYRRRADLTDPTALLDSFRGQVMRRHPSVSVETTGSPST